MPGEKDDSDVARLSVNASSDGPFKSRSDHPDKIRMDEKSRNTFEDPQLDSVLSQRERLTTDRTNMGIPDGQEWHTILDIARAESRDIAKEELRSIQNNSFPPKNLHKNRSFILLSTVLTFSVMVLFLFQEFRTPQLVKAFGEHACSNPRIVTGSTDPDSTNWISYMDNRTAMFTDIDISAANFSSTPAIFTSLGGNSNHWSVNGYSAVYSASESGFRVYLKWDASVTLDLLDNADTNDWYLKWLAIGC